MSRSWFAVFFAVVVVVVGAGCSTPTATPTEATRAPVAHGTVEHACEREAEGFDCTGCVVQARSDDAALVAPTCGRPEGSCPAACCGLCAKE